MKCLYSPKFLLNEMNLDLSFMMCVFDPVSTSNTWSCCFSSLLVSTITLRANECSLSATLLALCSFGLFQQCFVQCVALLQYWHHFFLVYSGAPFFALHSDFMWPISPQLKHFMLLLFQTNIITSSRASFSYVSMSVHGCEGRF